VTLTQIISAFY